MRLFRPAWDSKNWRKAKKAVAKITDEAKLERIAKEARREEARWAAIERLTNQSILVDIARNEYGTGRSIAIERVTDQSVLDDIAKNDKNSSIRLAAVKRVTDQSLLVDIAKNDEDRDVRWEAVKRVPGQSLVADVAQNDKDSYVRLAAVKRLTDQSLLADVARNGKDLDVCEIAVEKLTDPDLLADIERNGKEYVVRKAVMINKLINQGLLANVAWNNRIKVVVKRLTDPNLLADIARNDEDSKFRIAASQQLVNYDLEEDLLMCIIHMLGGILKNSIDESEKSSAGETLLAYYRRYRKGKIGEEIRMYEGKYKGSYNEYSDNGESFCCPENHDDIIREITFTINFNPEEA